MTLRHPIEVAVWANEEGGLFGSRAVSGQFEEAELAHVTSSGKTVRDGISFVGGDPARLGEARRARGSVAAYLELHIEQGGILEAEHVPIGIVEGIVGIRQWDVTVTGFSNHAGTTPMDKRQDALLSAARFVDMVNRVVRATPGRHVGTVGRLQVSPGRRTWSPAAWSVHSSCATWTRPRSCGCTTPSGEKPGGLATRQARRSRTGTLHVNAPAPSDPRMRSIIADAARALGLGTKVMPSGAGHDAQAIAQLGPMGMIFIPSVGGISHSPKEFSHPADIANGANVLLAAVMAADAM